MKRLSERSVPSLCILAFVLGVEAPGAAQADFTTPTAITNATVVVEAGLRLQRATILMDEGRILDVGGDVSVPEHAQIIDGAGLIAYPGFIDAHVHLGVSEQERTVDERRRTEDINPDVRQGALAATRFANRRGIRPQLRAIDRFSPETKTLEQHRAAGFTAALIAPRDDILGGTSDLLDLSDGPIRRSMLVQRVALQASFETGEKGEYPESLLGVFAQFRQVMLDAQWHWKLAKYSERHPTTAPRAPADEALDALQPVLAGSKPIIFEANTENEIRRALNLAAEFNLDLIISGGKEAWKVIDRLKAQRVSVIVSLKFDEEPDYGRRTGKSKKPPKSKKPGSGVVTASAESAVPAAQSDEEDGKTEATESRQVAEDGARKGSEKIYEPLKLRKERRRLWDEQVANVIRLHEANIPFALRTRDFKKPSEFFKNLRMVIERGLPEEAAVEALTLTPAFLFRMGDQLGALRRGRVANVTLMSGPLADEDSKVKLVFINGKKFKIEREVEKKQPKKDEAKPDDKQEAVAESEKPQADGQARSQAQEVTPEAVEHEGDTGDEKEDIGPTFRTEIEADRVPQTRTQGNVLIRNATIMPVSSATLTNASILVLDGKIKAIGVIESVPDGVTIIDGTGKFVLPGLIDCHSHLGLDSINESSVSISAEVRVIDVIDPQSVAIYRALTGGVTTHHAFHGSANPIGGQNVILKLKYRRSAMEMVVANAPRTIKFATGENVTQTNREERRGKRFPNSRMGVEAVYRTALEAGKQYRKEWEAYERRAGSGEDVQPLRRDLRLEALADILAGELTVHSHCYRSDEILRLIAVAEDYGFRIGTLQHVLEGYRIAPEIARHGCGASTFADLWAYKVEAYGGIPHNAALMTMHGVNASVNSDSANRIRFLNLEAAKAIKWGGLDENNALRLVTLNPAMQLQLDHRIGSLQVGKDGDIAIFNGHPLNTFSKCVMTLIEGEVYFEDKQPEPTEPCDTLSTPGIVDRTIPDTPHRAYAITGVTVHPISRDVVESATVVIVGDKIHSVGSTVSIPPGAGVIDGTGLHVYPGLIDGGSRLGLLEIWSVRATRDYSDTPTFSPHLRASSAIHPHSEHIRITRTAGVTTALTKPSGDRIAGQSSVIHLDGWTAPEMLVVDDRALHMTVPSLPAHLPKERKEKQTKEHAESMRELEAFIEKAKHYARVKGLAVADPQTEYEVDLALEAMVPYVRGVKPVIFTAHRYKHILDTIEFAQKHGLECVLSGATQAWKLADLLAEKDIAVILGTPLSYPRGKFEPWDSIYRCAGALDRAGVRFCFASENAASAYELPMQAGMAVAHGLPRERAEYALTLGAAQILGIADRVGSIEVGKQADLIITTDTPLQAASQVTHMFIDGKPIELTSMHTESYEKYKNRPTPELPPARTDLVGPPSLTRD